MRPFSWLLTTCLVAGLTASAHAHHSIRLAPDKQCEATAATGLRWLRPIGTYDKKGSLEAWGNPNGFERALYSMMHHSPRSEQEVLRRLNAIGGGSPAMKTVTAILTDIVARGDLAKRGKRYTLTTRGKFWLGRPSVYWRPNTTTTMRTFVSGQPIEIRFFVTSTKPRSRAGRFATAIAGKACGGDFFIGSADW